MKFQTLVMSNPGDYIKDGHLGKATFASEKDGVAVAWHLYSVAPSAFKDGVPVQWAVTICQKQP